ncbi:HpcH/HpaI aldolase/citrate lyase family protein [Endozoicomonas ascidiicola]|uniref:HpcH/HpaI aldolase/citrate lyase family protein n=1 Tax=Endozoicomonas ascidiicola TaxID=1698521 RepID=UPI000832D7CD|nr:HpcH/HpaI aldolase/citrate lyase family protein [Endozoicomonas ascidiicola]USN27008.1 HpcH/HpaI aldolase/citrate lyase family protein [synthetic construct]
MNSRRLNYFELGASLYTPCNHPNLQGIIQDGLSGARSMIFCLEDAVNEDEVGIALENLKTALQHLQPNNHFRRFIRPRNPMILAELLNIRDIEKIDGFVLPKVDLTTFPLFKAALDNHASRSFSLMPTLETEQVFDSQTLTQIRTKLLEWRENTCCLRIGGNDLMNVLGLKRMPGKTVYETPLRSVIDQLLITFRPYGFELSSPVFDMVNDPLTLIRELENDISYGFFAKTAIHPDQVKIIEHQYAAFVEANQLQAGSVIDESAPAVFLESGQMMERTCHQRWALRTLALANSQHGARAVLSN